MDLPTHCTTSPSHADWKHQGRIKWCLPQMFHSHWSVQYLKTKKRKSRRGCECLSTGVSKSMTGQRQICTDCWEPLHAATEGRFVVGLPWRVEACWRFFNSFTENVSVYTPTQASGGQLVLKQVWCEEIQSRTERLLFGALASSKSSLHERGRKAELLRNNVKYITKRNRRVKIDTQSSLMYRLSLFDIQSMSRGD